MGRLNLVSGAPRVPVCACKSDGHGMGRLTNEICLESTPESSWCVHILYGTFSTVYYFFFMP